MKDDTFGNSLAVQWLGLSTLTAEGPGSIPGGGTKIPQVLWRDQKKKKKKKMMPFITFSFCYKSNHPKLSGLKDNFKGLPWWRSA